MEEINNVGRNKDDSSGFSPGTVEEFVAKWLTEKVADVKDNLEGSKKEASFKLQQSVRFEPVGVTGGFRFKFIMEDYWIYVNDGRASGKFPPLKPIVDWIFNKPDFKAKIGGTRKGLKDMSIKKLGDISAPSNILSAAYGVAINLKKKGIKTTFFYSKVINDRSIAELKEGIKNNFKRDVEIALVKIADRANK